MASYFRLFGNFLYPKKCCRNCVDPGTKEPKRVWLCLQTLKGRGLRRNIPPLTGLLAPRFECQISKEVISPSVKWFLNFWPSYKLLKTYQKVSLLPPQSCHNESKQKWEIGGKKLQEKKLLTTNYLTITQKNNQRQNLWKINVNCCQEKVLGIKGIKEDLRG